MRAETIAAARDIVAECQAAGGARGRGTGGRQVLQTPH